MSEVIDTLGVLVTGWLNHWATNGDTERAIFAELKRQKILDDEDAYMEFASREHGCVDIFTNHKVLRIRPNGETEWIQL